MRLVRFNDCKMLLDGPIQFRGRSLLYRLVSYYCWIQFSLLICIFRNDLEVGAIISESKEFMSGKVVRAAVFNFPPSIIISEQITNGSFTYSGTSLDIIDYVAEALNISVEMLHVDKNDIAKYGIGPVQIQVIENNKVDIGILGVIASHSKFLTCDLSTPVLLQPFYIVVPWPKEESRLLAPIRPFQPAVWLCLGVFLSILAPVLSFLSGFYRKYIKFAPRAESLNDPERTPILSFRSILQISSFLLSQITNQGYHYDLRRRSRGSYILVGVWCLMAVVLANAYAGTLFSFLSVAKLEPIVNSLEELAHSKNLQLISQDRSDVSNRFLSATSGVEKMIGDSLRTNPGNLFSTLAEAKKKLVTGSYAGIYFNLFNYGLIDATYRENNKKCKLTIAKQPFSMFIPIVFPMAKNGPYTKAINEQIQALWEIGLMDIIIKNRMPRIDQCKMENQKGSVRVKPLSLTDLSSAFVVLGLGISLAFLVFLIERIIHVAKTNNRFRRKNNVLVVPPTPTVISLNRSPTNAILPFPEQLPPSQNRLSPAAPELNVPKSDYSQPVIKSAILPSTNPVVITAKKTANIEASPVKKIRASNTIENIPITSRNKN